jgi:hypothetical protein
MTIKESNEIGNALLLEAYNACQIGIMDNSLTKRIIDHLRNQHSLTDVEPDTSCGLTGR